MSANDAGDPRALDAETAVRILGISQDADDDEIRAAYLKKVKEHPPDRAPEQFERVRDAYKLLRDPRKRLARRLLSADLDTPLSSLFGGQGSARRFVGPQPWLRALGMPKD